MNVFLKDSNVPQIALRPLLDDQNETNIPILNVYLKGSLQLVIDFVLTYIFTEYNQL